MDKKFNYIRTAIAAAASILASGFSPNSMAAPITVSSSIAGGTYVSTSVSGNFDVSGLLLPRQMAVSGTVYATFSDNADPNAFSQYKTGYSLTSHIGEERATGTYSCGFFSTCTSYTWYAHDSYHQDILNSYMNASESAVLDVGGRTAGSTSGYFDSAFKYVGQEERDDYNIIAGIGTYQHYVDDYYSRTFGYSGDFGTSLTLDAAALADLNADGLLSFSVRSSSGDFRLMSVTLIADLVVPEPGSSALFGVALAGLGLSRRIRQRQSLTS